MSSNLLDYFVDTAMESNSTKQWAAGALQTPPPSLHSAQRSEIASSLIGDEARFFELTRQIEALCTSRNLIAASIARKRVLLSPYRLLPPELLSRIFILGGIPTFPCVDRKRNVLAVTRVSKYWRNVALATPELWSSIQYEDEDAEWADVYSLRRHLSRSGQAHLDLHVHAKKLCMEIYEELLAVAWRWGSAMISGGPSHHTRIWRVLPEAKNLHLLDIAYDPLSDSWSRDPSSRPYEPLSPNSWSRSIHLPTLKNLKLYALTLHKCPRFICPQLTEASFVKTIIPISIWNSLCRTSPLLRTVTLTDCHFLPDADQQITQPLSRCRALHIICLQPGVAIDDHRAQLIKSCSDLFYLDLYIRNLDLSRSISASKLGIIHLQLGVPVHPETEQKEFLPSHLTTFLGSLPSLWRLQVSWKATSVSCDPFFADSLILVLLRSPSGNVLCPNLRDFVGVNLSLREQHHLMQFSWERSPSQAGGNLSLSDDNIREKSNTILAPKSIPKACSVTLQDCFGLPNADHLYYNELKDLCSTPSKFNAFHVPPRQIRTA